METPISQRTCVPCTGNSPAVTPAEMETLKHHVPDWAITSHQGVMRLERTYLFSNFRQAMAFTQAVADIAEEQGHHPALLTEWGKVTVTWWTHAIQGLHRNDFIMAAKTDRILETLD